MAVLQLDFENLKHLDGSRLEASVNQELKRIMADLEDRPGDNRVRKLTISLSFKPIVDETGDLETSAVQFDCASRFPNRKSRVYSMKPRRTPTGPVLVFDEDSRPMSNENGSAAIPVVIGSA